MNERSKPLDPFISVDGNRVAEDTKLWLYPASPPIYQEAESEHSAERRIPRTKSLFMNNTVTKNHRHLYRWSKIARRIISSYVYSF